MELATDPLPFFSAVVVGGDVKVHWAGGDSVEGFLLAFLSWAKLVRTFGVDFGEHLPDLVGNWVFGGEGVGAGSDGDLSVAA